MVDTLVLEASVARRESSSLSWGTIKNSITGTLRLMLSKPISRTEMLTAKFIASIIYTVILLIWMAFFSLILSLWIFGSGDMLVFRVAGEVSQIMQIAQTMAGFSLAKADDFRRAISKKDNEVMLSLKQAFIDGAVGKGYKADHALSVYNHILKFADYGFNKSHSVAMQRSLIKWPTLKLITHMHFMLLY